METRTKKRLTAKTLAVIGMLTAVAFAAKLLSSVFPNVAGFLSFDLKDVVIVIGGFLYGPLAAAAITLVVSLASCSFACVAAVIYRKKHDLWGAILGLLSGTVAMTAVMLLWNWLITPIYMRVDRSVVAGMLLPTFLPFNLVKGGINATLALLLYKPIVTALRAAHLAEESAAKKGEAKWGVIIVALVLLATFILLGLVLAKVI